MIVGLKQYVAPFVNLIIAGLELLLVGGGGARVGTSTGGGLVGIEDGRGLVGGKCAIVGSWCSTMSGGGTGAEFVPYLERKFAGL